MPTTAKNEDDHVNIENCIADIRSWMSSNFLALNDAKTEYIYFLSKFKNQSDLQIPTITVGNSQVTPSTSVRNLGVIFDPAASMSSQVANICKTASYSLYRIGKVRKYIDNTTCERLVHAFISSRLDYCNSLLAGLPSYLIKRLQVIQNSAARLVTGINLKMSIHITPVLRQLHWLPVSQRIDFKILCLIYKCMHE